MHEIGAMNDLSKIWPRIVDLANDLGLPYPTVNAWFQDGRKVPPSRFPEIIGAAARSGHTLTYEQLVAHNAKRCSEQTPVSDEKDAA